MRIFLVLLLVIGGCARYEAPVKPKTRVVKPRPVPVALLKPPLPQPALLPGLCKRKPYGPVKGVPRPMIKFARSMVPGKEPIRRSIKGCCPCPYDFDRAGGVCGGNSAWSRPGGEEPRCYK